MASLLQSFIAGGQAGQQAREAREARQNKSRLGELMGQYYGQSGDPNAATLSQMAQINPSSAMAAQKQMVDWDDTRRKRFGQMAMIFNQLPDEQKAAAYPQFAAEAQQVLGVPIPSQWDPAFGERIAGIGQTILNGSGVAGRVQSTYIDAQGNRVAIMRDGSTQILGQNAPSNQIIDTGNGFYGVNKGNLQASPVMIGGQQPAPQQAPQAFMASDGTPVQIDPSMPPNIQAAIRASEMSGQPMPERIPQGLVMDGGGGQLRSAPKASEALAIERFNRERTRTLSPDEVTAAGFRPGTIVEEDGFGNRTVLQQPQAQATAAAGKEAAKARQKIPQLNNAVRGVERIGEALGKLGGGFVNTGPIDQYAQRFTKEGQELEAAVGAIQNSILALTRVPGVGSQSDLEQRVAMLQYPSLDKAPEVNARTLQNLRLFMQDLQAAYDNVTGGASPSSAPAQGGGLTPEEQQELAALRKRFGR